MARSSRLIAIALLNVVLSNSGTALAASVSDPRIGIDPPPVDPLEPIILRQSDAGATDESFDLFGDAVAAGDFDGDGFEDLAVGSPLEDQSGVDDTGMVVVFYGSSSGIQTDDRERFTQNSVDGSSNEEDDQFGRALAVGDFDRDGYDDLVVGAPSENLGSITNAGAVSVFYGSSSGLLPARSQWIKQSFVGERNEASDRFGQILATGDFDGDGFGDLAIGSP